MFTVKANKSHCRGRGIKKFLEDRRRSMLRSPLMPELCIHEEAWESEIATKREADRVVEL